jgi:hypothetical protein
MNMSTNVQSLRPALVAALAVAAIGAPMNAAAQSRLSEPEVIVIGAINDPSAVDVTDEARDSAVPEAPVVYEDAQAADAAGDEASAPVASADLNQTVETH